MQACNQRWNDWVNAGLPLDARQSYLCMGYDGFMLPSDKARSMYGAGTQGYMSGCTSNPVPVFGQPSLKSRKNKAGPIIFPRRKAGELQRGANPVLITPELLEHYFDLPLHKAAKHLGVCATAIKKACRKLGIMRWPFRESRCCNKSAKESADEPTSDVHAAEESHEEEEEEQAVENFIINDESLEQSKEMAEAPKQGDVSCVKEEHAAHQKLGAFLQAWTDIKPEEWTDDKEDISPLTSSSSGCYSSEAPGLEIYEILPDGGSSWSLDQVDFEFPLPI
uniref:RWP-RK domain-containing protein n=1 Tax=Hanusia phi TaxID=3032 RepID=A0A7S0EQB3_9CRYP|mmetsp:Transcript_29564/g.66890  ORF Transcript_29564/g.66890 Transcript_29564/m.66890 type:complete len:279 (+) Transcript_29564:189-1025(+)